MRRGLVIGNWKMSVNRQSAIELVDAIIANLAVTSAEVVVCPPYLYIPEVSQHIKNTDLVIGAQNVPTQEALDLVGTLIFPFLVTAQETNKGQCGE